MSAHRPADLDPRELSVLAVRGAVVAVLATAVVGLVLGGLAIETASAGDRAAVVSPTPEEVDADPGETVDVEVVLRSRGGHDGVGVESVALRALYHPDYLEVVDVEHGTWLAGGSETDVESDATIANDRGVTEVTQSRVPPAGGATGDAVFATLTVRVVDDAPPSAATIDFGETAVTLADGYPLPIYDRAVTVSIDGGGDPHESFDHGNLEDLEGSDPPVDDGTDGSDGGEADSVSGVLVAVSLLAAFAIVALARQLSR
ncbi:cohesin domain-containing protein [Natribaculum luteum]|uniref:Cohesin domain-containing protein n=1 Tax=Natribaculum luteum TaxID=1586232 RepID=A0ABD5P0I3_9EURY|nr:cohesin domain-containing protein [Natribaculum luteum]